MKNRCENCKFWNPETYTEEDDGVDFGIGLCIRFPPTISKDEGLEYGHEDGNLGKEAFFPVTPHNAYCGEHQKKGRS